MGKGISIFMGMEYSYEENIRYMKFARENGFNRIFTSLHIPEADYGIIINEFTLLVNEAKELGMEVIADISPKGFEYLNIQPKDLKALKESGIDVLRVDFGFSPEEIAEFSRNPWGLRIELNASTVTESFLQNLSNCNANYENIQACHNYYPRMNTGISIKSFIRKNEMLKKLNIKISAFVPSLVNKRGPIYEGLPTLEMHRFLNPETGAKHLFALGVDNVFFGDSIPTLEEITLVGSVPEELIEFKVIPMTEDKTSLELLTENYYTNRTDGAEDVLRAVESRMYINKGIINPGNTVSRKRGSVTVDNEGYLRYMGELQVCKKDLQEDSRANVIGNIVEEELFLLDCIEDEGRFKFKLV